jgi:hypothetical protein
VRHLVSLIAVVLAAAMPVHEIRGEAARHGTLGNWGSGNWGGSSFTVGRSTIYANGLVSNRVGEMTYFNNGLVGRQVGRATIYNNGLVSVDGERARFYSNYSVGVPVRGRAGGMVYGGGTPFPLGPTAFPAPQGR